MIRLLLSAAGVRAQAPVDGGATLPPSVAAVSPSTVRSLPNETDALQKRMERARALAAAHQLTSAAMELESIRASAKDEMSRNVSSLMLMGIYLEDGNYARAEAMLEESFKQRSSKNESSVRTYFALAGQAVNGARLHVGRYRTFGINVSNSALPHEATFDLDRLSSLVERMVAQAKELLKQNTKDNDAFALLEDLAGIRVTLARDNDDRARWQNEYSAARARLATMPTEAAVAASAPNTGAVASTMSPGSAGIAESTTRPPDADKTSRPAAPTAEVSSPDETAASTIRKPSSATGSIPDVGSLYEKATKIVKPPYPQGAKNVGAAGLVRVKVVIDESGSVANIVWTEGPMLFRQSAQDAVRQWKFQPVMVDGKAVRAAGYVDFSFSR